MSAEDLPEQPGDAADSSEEFEARKRQRTELEQSDPYSTKESASVDGADAAEPAPSDPGITSGSVAAPVAPPPAPEPAPADGGAVAEVPAAVPPPGSMPVATAGVPPMGSMGAVAAMAVPPAGPGQYGEMTTKVMLPNSKVGAVIGKQGTVIKAIRDNSGAKVNISETVAGQTERVISITGDFTQVQTAFTLMLQNMVSQPGTPAQQITDPLTGQVIAVQEQPTFTLLIPQAKAGGLIGKAGQVINQIRQGSGATIKVGNTENPAAMERTVSVSGPLEACLTAHHMVLVKLSEVKESRVTTMPGAPPGPPRGNPGQPQPPGYGMYGMQAPASAAPGMASNFVPVQFQVPNEMMGAVIGKAGASINEIRSMSGADIKIGDNEPGNPMRLVTVTGSPEQIQLAQYLIQIKMGGGQLPSPQQYGMHQMGMQQHQMGMQPQMGMQQHQMGMQQHQMGMQMPPQGQMPGHQMPGY